MKKTNKLNVLSIIITLAIVLAFILTFVRGPLKASAEHLGGEADSNQKSLLGRSDLESESELDNSELDNSELDNSELDNSENVEETLDNSGVSVEPSTTSPESLENPEDLEETEGASLGISSHIMPDGTIGDASNYTEGASLEASSYIIPDATIGYASDYTELKTLLEANNGIDYIQMTDNIDITGVINVSSSKSGVTIDGHNSVNGTRFRLTENKLSVGAATVNIYALHATTTYFELKNMEIDGYNYYGTVHGGGRATFSIKYDNVLYDGPQMTYVAQGTVHYKDVTATIRGYTGMEVGELSIKPGAAVAQELAESANTTFEGNINVQTASTGTSIWYQYGSNVNLTFLPGTQANFTSYAKNTASGGYFIYGSTLNLFSIGEGADVTFNTPSGFTYTTGMTIKNVLLEENSSLKIISNGTHAAFGRGIRTTNFDAAPNSNFLFSTLNASLTILGGTLNLNNPASFVTHSTGAYSPIYMTANSKVSVNAESVNLWDGAASLTDDIYNIPTNMWNKMNGVDNIVMNWMQAATVATLLTHNVVPTEDFSTNTPSVANINLYGKKLVVIGQYDLNVTGHNSQQNKVSGHAAPNSKLRVSYRSNNVIQTEYFSADTSGAFSFVFSNPVDIDTKPEVMVQQNYLKATHYAENLAGFSLEHVPAVIDFGMPTIPSTITTMRWADTTTDPWISVLDTRSTGSSWKLSVSAQPLTGTWNGTTHTLPNALLFIKDGQKTILSSAQQIIYQGTSDVATQTFVWNEQNGIFLTIDPSEAKTTSYTSIINWTLEDTP